MELPAIFRKTPKNVYRCVCGETFDSIDDACYHIDDEGFCENGMKECNGKYECKCGVKDLTRLKAEFSHYYDNKGKCIYKKELKYLTTCDTCNKDFHNISWYERHCQTEKHKARLLNPIVLDLECKVCAVKCTSQAQIKEHLNTKKHKERSKNPEPILNLDCKTCNIKCRGQKEMKKHLETKKHAKMNLSTTTHDKQ